MVAEQPIEVASLAHGYPLAAGSVILGDHPSAGFVMLADEQRGGRAQHRFYPVSVAIVGECGQDCPVLLGLGEPVFGIIQEIIVICACGIVASYVAVGIIQVGITRDGIHRMRLGAVVGVRAHPGLAGKVAASGAVGVGFVRVLSVAHRSTAGGVIDPNPGGQQTVVGVIRETLFLVAVGHIQNAQQVPNRIVIVAQVQERVLVGVDAGFKIIHASTIHRPQIIVIVIDQHGVVGGVGRAQIAAQDPRQLKITLEGSPADWRRAAQAQSLWCLALFISAGLTQGQSLPQVLAPLIRAICRS